ncbi:unnamed protein product [Rotaria magnacalcarata]
MITNSISFGTEVHMVIRFSNEKFNTETIKSLRDKKTHFYFMAYFSMWNFNKQPLYANYNCMLLTKQQIVRHSISIETLRRKRYFAVLPNLGHGCLDVRRSITIIISEEYNNIEDDYNNNNNTDNNQGKKPTTA